MKASVWLACMALVPWASMAQETPSTEMHDMTPVPSMATPSMDMDDTGRQSMLLVDQLEVASGRENTGPKWEAEAWYGNDSDKLWLRSEGAGSHGRIDEGDLEAVWNRAVSAFWSTQLGIRHDVGSGPQRNWTAFGVEGLAPYWIELEATAYAGTGGRLAARGRAQYTLRFTQRLIVQPELEINLYNRTTAQQPIGSGMSDAQFGLRFRYEITRQFAPYAGVVWSRRFGAAAAFVRTAREPIFDRQFVAGIRFWF